MGEIENVKQIRHFLLIRIDYIIKYWKIFKLIAVQTVVDFSLDWNLTLNIICRGKHCNNKSNYLIMKPKKIILILERFLRVITKFK